MFCRNIRFYKLWNRIIPVLLSFLFYFPTYAQNNLIGTKDSSNIQRVIYWIKKGQNSKAKNICQSILNRNPHNLQAEILLGRLYSWDSKFDSARIFLNNALKQSPNNEEALLSIVNVELWSHHLDQALMYSDRALKTYPNSESLLIRKARIYAKQLKNDKAIAVLDQILHLNPGNQEALNFKEYLKKKITNQSPKNGVGINYYYDYFKNSYSPWNFGSFYFFHKGKKGSINTKLNYANRFNVSGIQLELNVYPKITSSLRGYIGGSYSASNIFPSYSLAIGLYYRLFKNSELEGGVRYLNFKALNDPITIYTAAYSASFHRFFTSARTYLAPQSKGLNQSYYLTGIYYLSNQNKYISLTLNTGVAPHDYTDLITNETNNYPTHSKRIRIGYQTHFLSNDNIIRFSLGYEKRIYLTSNRERFSAGIGFERLF